MTLRRPLRAGGRLGGREAIEHAAGTGTLEQVRAAIDAAKAGFGVLPID